MKLVVRVLLALLAAPVLAVLAFLAWDVATYDAGAWRRDYEHLKRELAQNYANLDWIVERRQLDLAALDERTAVAIDNAHSRVRAFFALRDFIGTFNDPHLRIVWGERRATVAASAPGAVASCEAAGYEQENPAFELPIDRWPGWTQTASAPFAAGVAGELGIIRLHAFGENKYLDACAGVFQTGLTARELQLATRARLQQTLRHLIADLRARGATRLAIDLTGNGGGSEWSLEAVALFTDAALTHPPARLATAQCDRAGIWRGEQPCPVLEPAGDATTLTGEGDWNGALFLIANGSTASASEEFIAWLSESNATRIIGERTVGAGCGYVDDGGWIRLETAPFDVRAPNCARFLADGTNEIEGIAPDVNIDFNAAPDALAAALLAAMN